MKPSKSILTVSACFTGIFPTGNKILLINVVHIFHDPCTMMGWVSHVT